MEKDAGLTSLCTHDCHLHLTVGMREDKGKHKVLYLNPLQDLQSSDGGKNFGCQREALSQDVSHQTLNSILKEPLWSTTSCAPSFWKFESSTNSLMFPSASCTWFHFVFLFGSHIPKWVLGVIILANSPTCKLDHSVFHAESTPILLPRVATWNLVNVLETTGPACP